MTTNIAMTESGRLVHLDDDGHRDFSPCVQHAIRYASAAFLSAVFLLAILVGTGLMPPLPWSPMGQVEQVQPAVPSAPSVPSISPSAPDDTVTF